MATIKIVSWNVNGIRAAHRKGFLDWFEEERPDILCIQETRANEEQFPADLREMEGYQAYYSSAEKKGYSGVALYTAIEPVDIEPGFGIERFDSEGRTLQADMGDFVLFNVYFPNGRSSDERLAYKMEFYDAFLDHIEMLRSQGRNIIVCGDVNTAHKPIDLARPKENERYPGSCPSSVSGSTSWWSAATWTPSGCSTRSRANTRGGPSAPTRVPGTSAGVSTISL